MHSKEDFFDLYKILRLQSKAQHHDEPGPGFASIGQQSRRPLCRIGLLQLPEESKPLPQK